MDDSEIMRDEVIESYDKEPFQQVLMKRKQSLKRRFLYFTCIFVNYYSIINSC